MWTHYLEFQGQHALVKNQSQSLIEHNKEQLGVDLFALNLPHPEIEFSRYLMWLPQSNKPSMQKAMLFKFAELSRMSNQSILTLICQLSNSKTIFHYVVNTLLRKSLSSRNILSLKVG